MVYPTQFGWRDLSLPLRQRFLPHKYREVTPSQCGLLSLLMQTSVSGWWPPAQCRLAQGWLAGRHLPGPCLTTAIWRCHKNASQWQHSFQWKLCSHWLKFLRQRHVAVVRQGPGHFSMASYGSCAITRLGKALPWAPSYYCDMTQSQEF